VVRLNEQHLAQLRAAFERLLSDAHGHPDDDGARSTVLWTVIDREDRRASARPARRPAARARTAPAD
jgi:hypothetical protein